MEPCVGDMRKMKLSKEEKKVLRRQIKASYTLLRHEGINTVHQPSTCLVVCNGGLGNGVSRELLMELLQEGGAVKSLLMPPNKPYAYVTYTSLQDAQNSYALLNGRTLNHQNITLYCCYVEKVMSEVSEGYALPPGLSVWEEFVSEEEESALLQTVDWTSHTDDITVQKELKHRKVKHYGYEFRYDNNNVDKDKPLPGGFPQQCDTVLRKCVCAGLISALPDQLTVNQYHSGQGIPPHVDTHSAFEDIILSLSLGAQTVMDFRHPDGRSVSVVLPARSLLVMQGESRCLWTHGITPRKFDVVPAVEADGTGVVTSDPSNLTLSPRGTRTSFTFRKIRHTSCDCAYPSVCDSQRPPSPPPLPFEAAAAFELESRYVHSVYEEISSHFSSTRHSAWPRVRDFLLALPPAALLADVGCGNGKYLGVNPELLAVGCDRSARLVSICAQRGYQALVCDALSVPLRSATYDACISIAVIHHFSTQERRVQAVSELVRLLKMGGRALISVWALEQELDRHKSKYLKPDKKPAQSTEPATQEKNQNDATPSEKLIDNANHTSEHSSSSSNRPKLSVHTNRTAFTSQDLLVPWHLKNKNNKGGGTENGSGSDAVFHRYYHVFRQGELEALCGLVDGAMVCESYYDQGNWCVVLEKTKQMENV